MYPHSIQQVGNGHLLLARIGNEKVLLLINAADWSGYDDFAGQESSINGDKVKIAPTSHANACALRRYFPFTAAVPLGNKGFSMGMGDRLGLATPGHIQAIAGTGVRPVFAQQSVRELTLTGRSFADVLDDVTWGVFQEGYTEGFGADGDHLKQEREVQEALAAGYTMITLDCSERLDNTIATKTGSEINEAYKKLKEEATNNLEDIYLNKKCDVNGYEIFFDELNLKKIILTYLKAVNYVEHVYKDLIVPHGKEIDFEVSIDETAFPTTPEAHFLVGAELQRRGVKVTSMAPRFCGEFQKGIDYIGVVDEFERQFKIHAAIAAHFDYKLSIHSGSDKFKVFPVIGRYTKERLHLKTAGTSWLEALQVIARCQPELLCQMYQHALEHVDEAREYYHVSLDTAIVPTPGTITPDTIAGILSQDDTRQMMHITYGFFLHPKVGTFREKIYTVLNNNEDAYMAVLKQHLGRHIALVNIGHSFKGGVTN
ncbi:tagaturonate epimerase family protein [Moorella naiadis]|uniref:tagaturonate epimerase family protein n=1 Tax=Moorella naiadis (nom. illeg.) TaxID=3093670 RepID=UPI003D9C86A5